MASQQLAAGRRAAVFSGANVARRAPLLAAPARRAAVRAAAASQPPPPPPVSHPELSKRDVLAAIAGAVVLGSSRCASLLDARRRPAAAWDFLP